MKLIAAILSFFLFQSCQSQQAEKLPYNKDNNTVLWEISGKGLSRPSYLMGTFHLLCKTDIHFSQNLKKALKNVDEVYFEMNLDDASNTLGAMFFMNMKDGKTLKDLYSEKDYERLSNFFNDSLSMPLTMMSKIKPSFLEAFIYPKLLPCKSLSGVEEELLKIAKEDKKKINGFENIQFQASVFDSIPYAEQAQDLLKTVDSINAYKNSFDSMLNVYKTQQLSKIEAMLNDKDFGMADDRGVLLDNRNKNWVAQLKKILKKENVFIAVGCGHLVGSNGLIALLKKEGYSLKPLLNK
ncbi:MAG: TraB/GumN family protein [Bacteroidetes bacterium]|nr:TraB/GumN family protein [Bacteroidota bacterium]MBS1756755.1 TraB/GumN family protein [Bacteroidota bacterium]